MFMSGKSSAGNHQREIVSGKSSAGNRQREISGEKSATGNQRQEIIGGKEDPWAGLMHAAHGAQSGRICDRPVPSSLTISTFSSQHLRPTSINQDSSDFSGTV
jgi:hypothetical protein